MGLGPSSPAGWCSSIPGTAGSSAVRATCCSRSASSRKKYNGWMEGLFDTLLTSWGRILQGYRPALAIEITRECPLRCPGCYAYTDSHLGGGVTLREVSDYSGQELIDGVLRLVDEHRP